MTGGSKFSLQVSSTHLPVQVAAPGVLQPPLVRPDQKNQAGLEKRARSAPHRFSAPVGHVFQQRRPGSRFWSWSGLRLLLLHAVTHNELTRRACCGTARTQALVFFSRARKKRERARGSTTLPNFFKVSDVCVFVCARARWCSTYLLHPHPPGLLTPSSMNGCSNLITTPPPQQKIYRFRLVTWLILGLAMMT